MCKVANVMDGMTDLCISIRLLRLKSNLGGLLWLLRLMTDLGCAGSVCYVYCCGIAD